MVYLGKRAPHPKSKLGNIYLQTFCYSRLRFKISIKICFRRKRKEDARLKLWRSAATFPIMGENLFGRMIM